MVFSSIPFLFFYLPLVLAVYYSTPGRYRNLCLFLANLLFYGWGEPIYILLMLFSVTVNYVSGLLIDIRIYRLRFSDGWMGIYGNRADIFFGVRRQDVDKAEPLHAKIRSFLMNCTDYTTKKQFVSSRNFRDAFILPPADSDASAGSGGGPPFRSPRLGSPPEPAPGRPGIP